MPRPTTFTRFLSLLAVTASTSLCLTGSACTGGAGAVLGADAGADSYGDGDWLFEPERVLQVELEIEAADFERLRKETRQLVDILGEDCGDAPAPKVFGYVPASLTIEGEHFETVGVRKKGFLGSLSEDKPSLKIKMNEFVPGQRMSGLKRFTLNNAVQDPSLVNQCLGYDMFRRAGLAAPRCNFAHVTVNGESLGVYVHVESIKRPFLRLHFGDDAGNLYEGTLSDFREGWTGTFEKKTNESQLEMPEIDELSRVTQLEGAEMRAALEELVDMDSFFRFWAVEVLLGHWDGYSGNNNNFFLYGDLTQGQAHFMPWGIDQLFGDEEYLAIEPVQTRSILTRRLFQHEPSRADYANAMLEILDTAWDDEAVLAEIERMAALISPFVLQERRDAFDSDLEALRRAVTGREAAFRERIAGLVPESAQPVAEPLCFSEAGLVMGSFDTSYQGPGAASMSVEVNEAELAYTRQSSFAGPSQEEPGEVIVAFDGELGSTGRTALVLPMGQDELAPATLRVNEGFFMHFPPGSNEFDQAYFVSGTLMLEEASAEEGAPVRGQVELTLWDTPFF